MLNFETTLQELKIDYKKSQVGSEHAVYPSKRNPNRLYKVGQKPVVEEWLNIFQKYPFYFPQVFRAGKLNTNTKYNYYVEIEKLNTQRVTQEWSFMEEKLEELGYVDVDNGELIDGVLNTNIPEKMLIDLKKYDSKAYNLFITWTDFIHKIESIVKKNGKNYLDIHRYNFGYDLSGTMKCLDI